MQQPHTFIADLKGRIILRVCLFAIDPAVGGVITRPLQAPTRSAWRLITRGVGHYPKTKSKGLAPAALSLADSPFETNHTLCLEDRARSELSNARSPGFYLPLSSEIDLKCCKSGNSYCWGFISTPKFNFIVARI